jgi:hypothetical protein
VRIGSEQGRELEPQNLTIEEQVDADDGRVLERRRGLSEQERAVRRRKRDHECVSRHTLAIGKDGSVLLERHDPRARSDRRAALS